MAGCAGLWGWLAGSALGCVGPPMVRRRHGLASAHPSPLVSGSCAMGPLGGLMAGFVFGCGPLVPGLQDVKLGKTAPGEKAFVKLTDGIDEAAGYQIRQDIYEQLFQRSSAGEGYFRVAYAFP